MTNKNLSWYLKAWHWIKEKVCSLFKNKNKKVQQKISNSNKNKLKDGSINQVKGDDVRIIYNINKKYYNYIVNHRGEKSKKNSGKKCKFRKHWKPKNSYEPTLLRKNRELRKKRKEKKSMEKP